MKIAFGVSGRARPGGKGKPHREEMVGGLGEAKGAGMGVFVVAAGVFRASAFLSVPGR
jgi:hypothetical protein